MVSPTDIDNSEGFRTEIKINLLFILLYKVDFDLKISIFYSLIIVRHAICYHKF